MYLHSSLPYHKHHSKQDYYVLYNFFKHVWNSKKLQNLNIGYYLWRLRKIIAHKCDCNNFHSVYFSSHATLSTCFEDEFECSNGHCIVKGLLCDGVGQCGDGSDENTEYCTNYIFGIQCGIVNFKLM